MQIAGANTVMRVSLMKTKSCSCGGSYVFLKKISLYDVWQCDSCKHKLVIAHKNSRR